MAENTPKLNVTYWNANSILDKIFELYHFLDSNNIHVACIAETYLKPALILPCDPDYIVYRLDRETSSKGGVAIIVHKSIKHKLLPSLNLKYIECIGIAVSSQNGEWMNIHSLYVPGTSDNTDINNWLIRDINKITDTNGSYFACGDFNARHRAWNCARANRAGTLLYEDMCHKNYFIEFPDESTHFPVDSKKSPSTIDLMITNKLHNHTILTTTELASDHRAVSFSIEMSAKTDSLSRQFLNFKNADWEKYKACIHHNLPPGLPDVEHVTAHEQVDALVENFSNLILHAQDRAVPLTRRSSYKLELPDSLVKDIKFKNMLKRRWQRSRDARLKHEVNVLERIIKQRITILRNDNWSHKLSTIKKGDQNTWKTAKFLRKRKQFMPPLKVGDRILLTKLEKSNAIADSFESNHANPLDHNDLIFTHEIATRAQNFANGSTPPTGIKLTDRDEIEELTSRLKNQKAPGPDKISNRLIKNLPNRGHTHLAFIINCCLRLNYFPSAWKNASVIPIPKPNKIGSDPASYRPISLLSAVSKILERVILRRLQEHIDDNKILPDIQHGFRKNFSTTHQLYRVISSARMGLINKKSTGLIALDIEKAFDRIWFNGLICKMIDLKFPAYLIHITNSFLRDRTFNVKINGTTSTCRRIPAGAPQGAVLSPTLFNLYMHDVPVAGTHSTAQFADDTAIFKTAPELKIITSSLTRASENLNNYFQKWKINVNSQKTVAIFITNRKTREIPHGPINVFNNDASWSDVLKYLGIHIDKKLTFQLHIEEVIRKANLATKTLYPLINRKSKLHVENKIQIYKMAIRPILTYGLPALKGIAPTQIAKLQRFQNKTLKMILDRPWFERTHTIHAMSKTPLIADFIDKLTVNFLSKLN
jgi:hypothetical protein